MPTPISIQAEHVVDPRGLRKAPIQLAPRLANLAGKTVLLFDNTQLSSQIEVYGPILEWLAEYLTEKHGATCVFGSRNLFDISPSEMGKLSEEMARSGAQGVVIALCKAGMTQPTSLFAVELERHGLPCVQICTEHAIALAGTTAASYVPGLPIVQVEPATGGTDTFGKAETEAVAPEIVSGLTSDPATLLQRFQKRFASGDIQAPDGRISLGSITVPAQEATGGTAVLIDPGNFAADLFDRLCAADMCDGLPVIPPTEARVAAMLACTDLDPEHRLVDECPPSGSSITVRSLAVNAVMAGCRPEYFPVLVAAFQAISDPEYRLFQAAITTHPSGNAIIVSGPLAAELGIHSGAGCLGPGFRANATIGRAVNLTIMNVTRSIPNKADMSTFGSPAEFTYCFAESDKDNPWQPLHTEMYGADTTSVTVHKCEAPHNVYNNGIEPDAPTLLKAIAATGATPGGNNLTNLGQLIVLLTPAQAQMMARAGWSKQDVREFIFEVARHPQEATTKRLRPVFPPYFHKLARVPVMRAPEDVIVVVCGADGPHAMVCVPWGFSQAVTRPVMLRDGSPVRTVKGRSPF